MGSQRRTASGANLYLAALLVLAGLAFVVYGIVDFADGSSDAASEGAQLAASLFAGTFGLAMMLIGYVLFRRARPRRLDGILVEVERAQLRRGDPVDATVTLEDPSAASPDMEVGLVCIEHYEERTTNAQGTSYPETREAAAFEEWRKLTPLPARQGFRFELPADGPYTHDGRVLSFEWRVTVRDPQRMRADARVDAELLVAP